ncbi:MAG TPA: ATP-binding protein [Bacteroidales bacterium]|nr:ATP-binding protein [Bacteroidales bacterium]HSA44367.1 ATP-binding protein [Bacteroidales bacterium]
MIRLRYMRGLASKLILYIFSSLALIFAIIFYYNMVLSEHMVVRNIRVNAEYLTKETVEKVDKVLSRIQKVPLNMAAVLELSDFSEEKVLQLCSLVVVNNPDIFGCAIAFEPGFRSPDQKYYSPYYSRKGDQLNLAWLGGDGYDYFTMDWYQIPKMLGRSIWTEPYIDIGGGDIVMSTFSTPFYRTVKGRREFAGILTADVSLEWLQKIVGSVKVCESGYAFLISQNGSIVTHPSEDLIMNESIFSIAEAQQSEQLREIGRCMIRGETSFATTSYRNIQNNKKSYISYAPVPVNHWSLGIVFPVDELMADVSSLNRDIMLLGIGGLVLMSVVIVLISRSITRPLRRLTFAADDLAVGNFSVKLPEIKTKDEIARLNNSFISMQQTLSKTIGDLKETTAKLKVSNEKLEEYSRTLEDKVALRTKELSEKNRELDLSFQNIRILDEIGKKVTSTLDINLIPGIIYENVNTLMDATGFLVMVLNEKEHKLECKLSMENGQPLPLYEISLDETDRFAVWCVIHKEAILMNDVELEYSRYVPNRAKPKAGETVNALMYVPLILENRVLGVISAQSYRKGAYNQVHFDMLNNLANFVVIAFENATAYEQINRANNELKAAQTQLVQSEKMASLGQLTAGIAHEIKNPLNFVNNFSELSADLIRELSEELEKLSDQLQPGDRDYLREIMTDLKNNVVRINEHGKRADSIVRGMLLHSRGKPGDFQPTNINSVLSEYVNLGYHGMRAGDATFNIKLETSYDESIGMVNVVPQDISRVFLNIINNACYATNQKKKALKDSYFPVLEVETKNLGRQVMIRIRDNGNGIPSAILDKIFNPFFTTKPAGSGTGLGLSISYDIVVQQHHGEIRVDSKEGEYTEFIILLPKDNNQSN